MKRCSACQKFRPPKSFEHPEAATVCITCWVARRRVIEAQAPPPDAVAVRSEARVTIRNWANGLSPGDRERTVTEIGDRSGKLFHTLHLVAKEQAR